jgi:uncharacterized membrane protein
MGDWANEDIRGDVAMASRQYSKAVESYQKWYDGYTALVHGQGWPEGPGNLKKLELAKKMANGLSPPPGPSGPSEQPSFQTGPQEQKPSEVKLTLVPDTTDEPLEKCGSSCPDDATTEKLRIEMQANIDRENLAAEEAQSFAAAVGDQQKLSAYISSCKICEFRDDANREVPAAQKTGLDSNDANWERYRYNNARGNIKALSEYVADCKVCAFASAAVEEINQASSNSKAPIFELEICNEEYLAVRVAYAGIPDPNSDMWITEGWYEIESGKCRTIATLKKGYFYVHAHNKHGVWSGGDVNHRNYCTPNNPFTRILLEHGDECSDEESLTKFGEILFQGDESKYTWTLTP